MHFPGVDPGRHWWAWNASVTQRNPPAASLAQKKALHARLTPEDLKGSAGGGRQSFWFWTVQRPPASTCFCFVWFGGRRPPVFVLLKVWRSTVANFLNFECFAGQRLPNFLVLTKSTGRHLFWVFNGSTADRFYFVSKGMDFFVSSWKSFFSFLFWSKNMEIYWISLNSFLFRKSWKFMEFHGFPHILFWKSWKFLEFHWIPSILFRKSWKFAKSMDFLKNCFEKHWNL